MPNELDPPAAAVLDDRATELLRVWATKGSQHVSIRWDAWDDPAAWGILLVDLARHVAHAYEQNRNMTPAQVLHRIREGFDAEWSSPSDSPRGQPSS